MKKLILAAAVLGLAGLGLQNAKASDLGKFLDGAVAIHEAAFRTLADVVHDVTPRVNVNVGLRPVYLPLPAPIVYAPAPRVVLVTPRAPHIVYHQPAPVVYRARVQYAPRVSYYRDRDYRGDYDRAGHYDGNRR